MIEKTVIISEGELACKGEAGGFILFEERATHANLLEFIKFHINKILKIAK